MAQPAFSGTTPNQFVCHIQGKLDEVNSLYTLEEISDVVVELQQKEPASPRNWIPCQGPEPYAVGTRLHLSIFRGHMAVAFHQIEPMLAMMKTVCATIPAPKIRLDSLRVFKNFEGTKEFLCFVERPLECGDSAVKELKDKLRPVVDKFTIKLTEEKDTNESITHCSLMYREITGGGISLSDAENLAARRALKNIEKNVAGRFGEIPFIRDTIRSLDIIIGNECHNIMLGKPLGE